MKKVLISVLTATMLFGMGADTVESLTICKGSDKTLLITIIQSEDNKNDRAIFVNDYEALSNAELEYFVPIQNPKSLRTVKSIEKWTSEMFGKVHCAPIDYQTVQAELDKQNRGE